jgi:hypothetical protein
MLAEQTSPVVHAVPHPPQSRRSVARSRHMPPQSVRPGVQLTSHVPAVQISPGPHTRPHAPQLARSVRRSRQMPEQFVVGPPQVVWHVPPEQS